MPRIKGHALIGDGWAHDADGNEILRFAGVSITGRAKCKCGWLGVQVTSQVKRRNDYAWHLENERENLRRQM